MKGQKSYVSNKRYKFYRIKIFCDLLANSVHFLRIMNELRDYRPPRYLWVISCYDWPSDVRLEAMSRINGLRNDMIKWTF